MFNLNNYILKNKLTSKKTGDNKATFHAKMCTIKDRDSKNLAGAEEVKKRWQEYTEQLDKKDLNCLDSHDGVVIHLEPDILECEIKWTLGSITMNKANGGDGIPAELFQILKDDAVNDAAFNVSANLENSTDGERSVFIPIPRKSDTKDVQTMVQLCTFHMLATFCSKSFKLGLSSM